jgi:hypothetical protein
VAGLQVGVSVAWEACIWVAPAPSGLAGNVMPTAGVTREVMATTTTATTIAASATRPITDVTHGTATGNPAQQGGERSMVFRPLAEQDESIRVGKSHQRARPRASRDLDQSILAADTVCFLDPNEG